MTSSLWRTERPRFPLYSPDGRGRDYYIKFDNGGYWAGQFQLKKIPDYERPRYRNFHTLFHQAAPFKYWGDGHGRETYILQNNGLFHDQKPLCAYKLSDFLRKNFFIFNNYGRKLYMSVSEKKYNNELRKLEKQLIKRLYTTPMNTQRTLLKQKKLRIDLDDPKRKTFTGFNYLSNKEFIDCKTEKCNTIENTDLNCKDSNKFKTIGAEANNSNTQNKCINFNKTCDTFHRKKNLNIKIVDENVAHFDETDKAFKNFLENKKVDSTINATKNENEFMVDPRSPNNNKMKISFKFKPKPKSEKIKIQRIKVFN